MTAPPLVVIGAGPIGLAAASNARSRGMDVVVLEAGDTAGHAVRQWGHVRLFSPWSELVDPVGERLLVQAGWKRPPAAEYPTGADWAREYLQPLADVLTPSIRYGHRVTGVAKQGRDRLVDAGRGSAPYVVHVSTAAGEQRIAARAVVDASGTWSTANPLGGDGLPAVGEKEHSDRIAYRIPDFRDVRTLHRYAGKHTVVAGTGASAMTVLIELANVAAQHPGTRISWLVRRSDVGTFGGGADDQLVARGALGLRAHEAVDSGRVRTITGFRASTVGLDDDGRLRLDSFDGQHLDGVDEIVVVTGFRPDLAILSGVRLDLDPVLHAPRALAPLIDPNVHSCGTVYPHGAQELAQPDAGFYLTGMKSYGRATSFLALTGYEQARSVVAAIAGDDEAAANVELTLPETGVCGGAGRFDQADGSGGGCCTAPTVGPLVIAGSRAQVNLLDADVTS